MLQELGFKKLLFKFSKSKGVFFGGYRGIHELTGQKLKKSRIMYYYYYYKVLLLLKGIY